MSVRKTDVNGFPSLAAFVASDADKTTLIFKRFDRLAARNLLHLQSELARLQKKLDSLDEGTRKNDDDPKNVLKRKQYLRNWDEFISAAEDSAQEKERLELSKSIQAALKNYHKCLLLSPSRCSVQMR
jgi:hypothetical protein